MKYCLFFFYLLFFTKINAQDLTGIWHSMLAKDGSGYDFNYEMQINHTQQTLKGVSYSISKDPYVRRNPFEVKCSLVGTWSSNKKKLDCIDSKVLVRHDFGYGDAASFSFHLVYKKLGNKEVLEGLCYGVDFWTRKELNGCGIGPPLKVHFERVTKPYKNLKKEDFIIRKENELAKLKKIATDSLNNLTNLNPLYINQDSIPITTLIKPITTNKLPSVLQERTNQLFKTISVSANEIEISFYDNGEIDGDTISIYLNGKQLAAHKRLTAEPVTIKIKIDEDNPEQEVIMVAENLGTIPPNTALMIVKVGGKRYEINLSSTEQENAMVKFKYQKE